MSSFPDLVISNAREALESVTQFILHAGKNPHTPSHPLGKTGKYATPNDKLVLSEDETTEQLTVKKLEISNKDMGEKFKKLVWEFEPKQVVVPFTQGYLMHFIVPASTGFVITRYYRRFYNLHRQTKGLIPLAVAGFLGPALLNTVGQQVLVTRPMLSGFKCPVCLETRSALLQVANGVFVPLVVGNTIGAMMANLLFTKAIPVVKTGAVKQGLIEVTKFMLASTKPLGKKLAIMSAINVISVMILMHMQFNSLGIIAETLKLRRGASDVPEKIKAAMELAGNVRGPSL